MKKDNLLIIFAREPELGCVKTRIAKRIGEIKSLEIYIDLLQINKNLVESKYFDAIVYAAPKFEILSTIYPEGTNFKLQTGEDLGERLSKAFDESYKSYRKIIAIGVDCPFVTEEILIEAFLKIKNNKIVIGPCNDGGYYLIGVANNHSDIFDGIDWGSNKVLAQTVNKCSNIGCEAIFLNTLYDIDIIEDYNKWKSETANV